MENIVTQHNNANNTWIFLLIDYQTVGATKSAFYSPTGSTFLYKYSSNFKDVLDMIWAICKLHFLMDP